MKTTNTTVTLTVISILLIAMVITLAVNIYSIKMKGEEDLQTYREVELEKVKQALKNYVDIAYATIDSNYKNVKSPDYLQKYYGTRLKSVVEVAETVLNAKEEAVKAGKLTLAEAQKQAMEEIKRIRYDDGKGYVWINDTGKPFPKMIMHPTLPELDGKVLDNPKFNTALGKGENLFIAFVKACEENKEGGFVDYLWPKPLPDGTLLPDVPKLSYVKLFRPWNWIFGTGVYVDDAFKDSQEKSISDVKQMRYDNGVGYFWINDTTKPTPRMIMHPTIPSLDDKIMDDPKYKATLGKYTKISPEQNLFEAFLATCEASEDGSGFVDYRWPKPTQKGLTEEQPKMSYVRLHKELGWIVGSGAYIDNIESEINTQKAAMTQQIWSLIYKMVVVSILIILLGMVTLRWVLNKYLSRVSTPLVASTPSVAVATGGEGGGVTMTPSIRDEYLNLARDLGQTMLAEQTKLLAFTASVQAVRSEELAKGGNQLVQEVRQLAGQTQETVEGLQKTLDTLQKYSEVNTLEIAKMNQLMNTVSEKVKQIK